MTPEEEAKYGNETPMFCDDPNYKPCSCVVREEWENRTPAEEAKYGNETPEFCDDPNFVQRCSPRYGEEGSSDFSSSDDSGSSSGSEDENGEEGFAAETSAEATDEA